MRVLHAAWDMNLAMILFWGLSSPARQGYNTDMLQILLTALTALVINAVCAVAG